MSTIIWYGGALPSVAQVNAGAIAGVDGTPSNNTFTVTIGGVTVSVAGTVSASATAGALAAALAASAHPYFTAIQWTNDSGALVSGTAKTPGVPFVAVLSKSGGGTGTVTSFSITASAGPNDWNTAANWSGGVVPATGDTVIIANNSVPIAYGLDQSAVTLAKLRHDLTATGPIGLPSNSFATDITGSTPNSSVYEYRQASLKIGATIHDEGLNDSNQSVQGAGRLRYDFTTVATTSTIYNSNPTPLDAGLPTIQLLANSSSSVIYVRSGNVGIAVGPGETSTVNKLTNVAGTLVVGSGVTFNTSFTQSGSGSTILRYAVLPTAAIYGGSVTIEGTAAITTMNCYGGTTKQNSTGQITTANWDRGATIDMGSSARVTLITTLNWGFCTVIQNPAGMTVTNPIVFTTPSRTVSSLP